MEAREDAFVVTLDKRPLKTPSGNQLSIPKNRPLAATLIAADKYSRMHQQQVAVNTSQWPLNENGRVLELNDFPARIRAKI